MSVLRLTPEQAAQHQQRVKGQTGIKNGIKKREKGKIDGKSLKQRSKYGYEKIVGADGKTVDTQAAALLSGNERLAAAAVRRHVE